MRWVAVTIALMVVLGPQSAPAAKRIVLVIREGQVVK